MTHVDTRVLIEVERQGRMSRLLTESVIAEAVSEAFAKLGVDDLDTVIVSIEQVVS